jgi:hypothetical protein
MFKKLGYNNSINEKISITVGEPISRDSGLSKHTVYNIKGHDSNGEFDVFRRYSEFD